MTLINTKDEMIVTVQDIIALSIKLGKEQERKPVDYNNAKVTSEASKKLQDASNVQWADNKNTAYYQLKQSDFEILAKGLSLKTTEPSA